MVSALSKSLAVAIYVIVSSTMSGSATDRIKRNSIRREEQKEFGRLVYDAVEIEREERALLELETAAMSMMSMSMDI